MRERESVGSCLCGCGAHLAKVFVKSLPQFQERKAFNHLSYHTLSLSHTHTHALTKHTRKINSEEEKIHMYTLKRLSELKLNCECRSKQIGALLRTCGYELQPFYHMGRICCLATVKKKVYTINEKHDLQRSAIGLFCKPKRFRLSARLYQIYSIYKT